jgi:hypothetical protein
MCLIFFVTFSGCAQVRLAERGDEFLSRFVVWVDDKAGFIDRTGKLVIHPQFELADDFSEGRAAVRVGESFGYINMDGDMIVPPVYYRAQPFREGLAAVSIDARAFSTVNHFYERYGFVDRSGNLAMGLRFLEVTSFSEGLAGVRTEDESYFIDKSGEAFFRGRYQLIMAPFAEGLALVIMNDKWNYVNKEGESVITLDIPAVIIEDLGIISAYRASFATSFSEGLAVIHYADRGWCDYIDSTGALKFRVDFGYCSDFSEGFASVCRSPGSCGYIDHTGAVVIPPIYESVEDFSEGLAVVRTKDDTFYIDRQGAVALNPKYRRIESFRDGLAAIRVWPDEWPPDDPSSSHASASLAPAVYREQLNTVSAASSTSPRYYRGYIDKTGAWVWRPTR